MVARKRSDRMAAELPSYHRFDSISHACYACTLALFPAAHLLPVGGGCRCARLARCSWHCNRCQDGDAPVRRRRSASSNSSPTPAWCRRRCCWSCWCSRSCRGGSSSTKAVAFRARRAADARRSSTSSARAASSPKCRRSARRSASPLVGVFQAGYAELNAAVSRRRAEPRRQSGPPAATSNAQEPGGGRSGAAARVGGRRSTSWRSG